MSQTDRAAAGADPGGLVAVRILGLPVPLYQRTRERHEGLLREFALIALGEDPPDLPARLLEVSDWLGNRYGSFTAGEQQRLEDAVANGAATVDLVYRVPPIMSQLAQQYDALLDEVDDFCRRGDLLTLAADDDIRTFRSWFLGEFTAQIEGGEPTPWGARD